MASTTGTDDQNSRGGEGAAFGFQVNKATKANIRGSQDLTRDNNIFSPAYRSGMNTIQGDDQSQLISI